MGGGGFKHLQSWTDSGSGDLDQFVPKSIRWRRPVCYLSHSFQFEHKSLLHFVPCCFSTAGKILTVHNRSIEPFNVPPLIKLTWKVRSQSWRPEGGGPEVTRRRWAECPLASRRSPNVVGVAWARLEGLRGEMHRWRCRRLENWQVSC